MEKNNIIIEKSPMEKPIIWIPIAIICTMLWGSAFPSVKMGYKLFQVNTESVYSIFLFAGSRFALAGVLTLVLSVFVTKKLPKITYSELRGIAILGLVQTSIQYTFFYISLSNTTGVNGSIISGTSGFIGVGLASLYYRNDKLTKGKVIGCILGFIGVVVLNMGKGGISTNFAVKGELFMVFAAIFSAFGALISKELTNKTNSFVVTGYQLLIGGAILAFIGSAGGGVITPERPSSIFLLIYLSLISTFAFGLWATLLKYHPLSKISIFHTLIPVFGMLLSVAFLGEQLRASSVIALALIIGGIIILNRWKS